MSKSISRSRQRLNLIRDHLLYIAPGSGLGKLYMERSVGDEFDRSACYQFDRVIITVHIKGNEREAQEHGARVGVPFVSSRPTEPPPAFPNLAQGDPRENRLTPPARSAPPARRMNVGTSEEE